ASVPDEWGMTVAIPGSEGAGQKTWEQLASVFGDAVTLESILVPDKFLPYVEISSQRADGLPVVRGTSVRTALVRSALEAVSEREFSTEIYPHIDLQAARAARDFERMLDKAA